MKGAIMVALDGAIGERCVRRNRQLRRVRARRRTRGLDVRRYRQGDAEVDGGYRSIGAQRTERAQAERFGNVSVVREEGRVAGGRLRRSEVQARERQGRPGRRDRLALEGWRQLLRRARQRAGEQRLPLLHGERQTQHPQVRERARPGQCLAHAARGVLRNAYQGAARRRSRTSSRKTVISEARARSGSGRRRTASPPSTISAMARRSE